MTVVCMTFSPSRSSGLLLERVLVCLRTDLRSVTCRQAVIVLCRVNLVPVVFVKVFCQRFLEGPRSRVCPSTVCFLERAL